MEAAMRRTRKKGSSIKSKLILGFLALCCISYFVNGGEVLSSTTTSSDTPNAQVEQATPESSPSSGTDAQTNPSTDVQGNSSYRTEPKPAPDAEEPLSETPPDTNSEPDPAPPTENSTFSVHFIDVGQADAALVECDGHYMLIDGGNRGDSSIIYSVLKKADVSHLDIVVGTHAHEDHIGGLPGAFNYTSADLTLCPVRNYDSKAFANFEKYADKNGGGITVPAVGDTYILGSARVDILGVNGGDGTNNTSIVLKVTYGDTKFLFTGDAEREAEQAILNSGADLSATVLKVGHHGSETSTSYLFLREVAPSCAVISVGSGNSYGHPTEEVLSRLRDADVKVYRTDMQGDIRCTNDGTSVSFTVARNADADTLAAVAKPEPSNKQETQSKQQTQTKQEPQAKQEEQTEPSNSQTMVWIPSSGKKYHSYPSCSRMKNPTEVTQAQAEAWGYTACKKCW